MRALPLLVLTEIMKKKYKSKLVGLSLLADVKGRGKVSVEFKEGYIFPNSAIRGCVFETEDEALQEALEKHEWYKRALQPSFWTDDVTDDVVEEQHKEQAKDEGKKGVKLNK